ncbi:MAG: response regulator, partial [Proteobacteria bacterium]|nr:response regulator [Pseudomonadota bacterium]
MDVLQDKSVLVVDDEPMLREILRDVLEFEGARVCEAAHAKDALARLSQEPVDAVISDIRMPGGDGFELLAGIRDRDTGMPVVLMITGFSDISAELAYA